MTRPTWSIEARLFRRREKGPRGCWLWTGTVNNAGYGQMKIGPKVLYVHRIAYELYKGPIPDKYQIDHLCREKLCFFPGHLEAMTQRENIERSNAPWAVMMRTNKCKRGHEMTEENIYRKPSRPDVRECRACIKLRNRKYNAQRQEARCGS